MWQWLASSFNGATPAAGAAGATTNAVAAAGSPAAGAATTAAGKWYESPKFIEFLGNAARFGASIAPDNPVAQGLGGLGYDMGQSKLMARNNNRITAPQQRPLGTAQAGAPAPGSSTATLPPVGSMSGGGAPQAQAKPATPQQPTPLASTAQGNTWADYARAVLGFNGGSQSAPEAAPDFTGLSPDNQQAVMRAFLAQQGMMLDERNNALRMGMDLYQNDQQNARQDREMNQPKPFFNEQGGYVWDPVSQTFRQQFTAPQQPKYFDLTPGAAVVGIDPATGREVSRIDGPAKPPAAPNYQLKEGADGKIYAINTDNPAEQPVAVPGISAPQSGNGGAPTYTGREDSVNKMLAMVYQNALITALDANGYDLQGNPNPAAVYSGIPPEAQAEWMDLSPRMNDIIKSQGVDAVTAYQMAVAGRQAALDRAKNSDVGQAMAANDKLASLTEVPYEDNADGRMIPAGPTKTPTPSAVPTPVMTPAPTSKPTQPMAAPPGATQKALIGGKHVGWLMADGRVIDFQGNPLK